jgi:hypothetical protein
VSTSLCQLNTDPNMGTQVQVGIFLNSQMVGNEFFMVGPTANDEIQTISSSYMILPEPGSSTPQTLTIAASDNCLGGHAMLDSVAIDMFGLS